MSLVQITAPSASQQQLDAYNGSQMVARSSYNTPPGKDWAVIVLVLVDAATPAAEAPLVAALEGLAGIVTVANPRLWGQLPASLEIGETYECKLHVTVTTTCTTGTAENNWSLQARQHATTKPPLGKKWVVVNCIIPAALTDQASVDALESACKSIAGVTTAKVVMFGSVPNPANNIIVIVESRMRIDEIPLEE